MVYCLKARLVFTTTARRDAVRNALEQRLATKPARWQADTITSVDIADRYGAPRLEVRLWLTTQADAQDLADRLQSATSTRSPQPGSYIAAYASTADQDGLWGGQPFFAAAW